MSDGQQVSVTKEDLLARLRKERMEFDGLVAHVNRNALEVPPEGHTHSPKEIVAHVTAYEELIVSRLRAAGKGETTEFDRDRIGWEHFNERIWHEAKAMDAEEVLERSARVYHELVEEVGKLSDRELNAVEGLTEYIDRTWLRTHSLGELIAMDSYEHYPMHREALEDAAKSPTQ